MTPAEDVKLRDRAAPEGSLHVFIMPETVDAQRIWGLTASERLQHMLAKMGLQSIFTQAMPSLNAGDSVLMLRGDVLYEQSVLSGLAKTPGILVASRDGETLRPLAAHVPAADGANRAEAARAWLGGKQAPPSGMAIQDPADIGEAYRGKLRKREAPYCIDLTRTGKDAAERRLYQGAYKGVTDLVTKHVWPTPAFHVTRVCARLGITPNAVTAASFLLMLAALWLFWQGAFGAGLLAGWLMTFLDTVDGKLARVTLKASPFGHFFDHGMDIVHPPFWYLAWGIGLGASGMALPEGWFAPLMTVIFGGYILGRLTEGYFKRRFGLELFIWRPFDSVFRQITARRNPCMILLTLGWLAGRPDLGLIAVAAWTAISTGVQLVRIAQGEAARLKGRPVSCWLEAPRPPAASSVGEGGNRAG